MLRVVRKALAAVTVFTTLFCLGAPPARAATYQYTALGDSISFGAIALFGFVPRYEYYLATDNHASATYYDLGQLGWTSSQLLQALQSNPAYQFFTATSNVITYQIGGNDLIGARNSYKSGTCGGADNQDCLRAAAATLNRNFDGITAYILFLRGESLNPRHTIIRTMDIYNPFVAVDQTSNSWPADGAAGGGADVSDFVVFKYYLDQVNAHIFVTSLVTGIKFAPVYAAFNGMGGTEDPRAKG